MFSVQSEKQTRKQMYLLQYTSSSFSSRYRAGCYEEHVGRSPELKEDFVEEVAFKLNPDDQVE